MNESQLKPRVTGRELDFIVAEKVREIKRKLRGSDLINPTENRNPKVKKSLKQKIKERANRIRSRRRNYSYSNFTSKPPCDPIEKQKLSNIVDYSKEYIYDILPLFKLKNKIKQKYEYLDQYGNLNQQYEYPDQYGNLDQQY